MGHDQQGCEGLSAFCPRYHHAIEIIGRRWTGAVIRAMLSGASRFNEIAHAIPGISDRLLSERLKELETEGLLVRSVIPETPVRVEYHLTPKGRSLEPVIRAVAEWCDEWAADLQADLQAHAANRR
jgi:DNA-binding HxlR family transcriptional regulator